MSAPHMMDTRLYNYRRHLPHFQKPGRPLFITFRKLHPSPFPPEARNQAMECCRAGDGKRFVLHAAVIMPDHVHLLLTPLADETGWPYSLPSIMKAIKGASARKINRLTGDEGSVWQDESFDHVLRNDEGIREKMEYIRQNPMRKGLVARPEDYEWLWLEDGWLL